MTYTAEQIIKSFDKIPKITSRAIQNTKVDEKIKEIAYKYNLNENSAATLNTYIYFVLVGLINNNEFEDNIIKYLNLTEEIFNKLNIDINELIFDAVQKKINELEEQEKLISFLPEKKEETKLEENLPHYNKTEVLQDISEAKKINKRFEVLPKNLQEAISKSDYETKIYEISQKYKLPIDQMGILEEAIIKTILGDINLNGLGLELKLKITLPDEEIMALVNEVNTEIFKKIRMLLRYETSDIPLPPYREQITNKEEVQIVNKEETPPAPNYIEQSKEEDIPLPNYGKPIENTEEKELYKEHGIEMVEGESFNDDYSLKKHSETQEKNALMENNDNFQDSGIDIIGNKLTSPTVSTSTISDYSIPKMSRDKDPYKEQI